jgi:toxin CcdB
MPQFDVYRMRSGTIVLDCQADRFQGIGTRFVVPLAREGESAPTTPQLHPRFDVNGDTLTLMTELAAAIRTADLGKKIASLAHEHHRIICAIDVLTGTA